MDLYGFTIFKKAEFRANGSITPIGIRIEIPMDPSLMQALCIGIVMGVTATVHAPIEFPAEFPIDFIWRPVDSQWSRHKKQ